jgi:hypothetical protein
LEIINNVTKDELEAAFGIIASMINKTEKAKEKFTQGTSQHTLQKNRLNALTIVSSLISKELAESDVPDYYKQELGKALSPIASLISKSEKARNKLKQGTWQHTILSNNLKALHLASPLLTKALNEISVEK